MNKIEQGIEINNQHIYNVINQIPEEISFNEQIINLGFKDLEDFFEQKKEYEMQQFLKGKVFVTNPIDGLQLIQNKNFGIISVDDNYTFVYKGNNKKEINMEYCQQNNIPVYNYGTFGGAVVVSPGDYNIGVVIPIKLNLNSTFFLNNIALILKRYFENVKVDNNDILIDNRKVLGSANFGNEEYFFFVAQISFSDKTELIQSICGDIDENGKQPGYINPNILSTNKLREELLSWLQGL